MPKEDGAYTRSLEEVFAEAEQARGMPTTRVPHRRRPAPQAAAELLHRHDPRASRSGIPHVHIKALTAVEIAHLARIEKIVGARGADRAARRPGSPACPAAAPRCSAPPCAPRSPSGSSPAQEWIRVHRAAHELGIPDQLHHAVRPRRDGRRPDRAPRHAARRCRTRPAASSPTSRWPITPTTTSWARSWAASGTATTGYEDLQEHRRRPAVPRQHPAREDPLADGDAVPVADRARASAATTSRARWCTSGSTTRPARTPQMHMPYDELVRADPRRGEAPGRARQPLPVGARRLRRPRRREPRLRRGAGCRWCTPHEARPHPLDQLLPGLRGDRSRPRAVRAELVTGTASELNDLLAAGELDVSVVSAVEYARNAAAYHLLPDLAITCDGPVHSVALFSRRPVDRARRRARCCCTASSRTSVLLLELLCRHRWKVTPALRHRARRGDRSRRRCRRCRTTRCSSSATRRSLLRRRGAAIPFQVDLGAEWKDVDRPAVRVRGLGRAPRRRPVEAVRAVHRAAARVARLGAGASRRARRPGAARTTGVARAGVPRLSRRSRLRALLPAPRRAHRLLPPAGAGRAGARRRQLCRFISRA